MISVIIVGATLADALGHRQADALGHRQAVALGHRQADAPTMKTEIMIEPSLTLGP